jgi:hypothetical protein
VVLLPLGVLQTPPAAADPVSSDTPRDHVRGGPLYRRVDALARRRAWTRLLAKVHELDIMACPRCGSRMSVIAVIFEPAQIRKIIDRLDRDGSDLVTCPGSYSFAVIHQPSMRTIAASKELRSGTS